jgi:hypothetical protein
METRDGSLHEWGSLTRQAILRKFPHPLNPLTIFYKEVSKRLHGGCGPQTSRASNPSEGALR